LIPDRVFKIISGDYRKSIIIPITPFAIILGHPNYYPSFGFIPASHYDIKSEYEDVPNDAFMILVFDQASIEGVTGVAKYRPEFGSAM